MDDRSLVEMSVVKVSPYLKVERPLLWLCERKVSRPRLLPIAIGQFEAAAIQMQLDQDEPLRPISYDLLTAILNRLSVPVRRVVIHTAHKQIYYAKITIEKEGQPRELDSRPSDAIALALRTGAPVYVSRELLELVGYEAEEGETQIEQAIARFGELEPQIITQKTTSAKTAVREKAPAELSELKTELAQPAPTSQADMLSQLQAKLLSVSPCGRSHTRSQSAVAAVEQIQCASWILVEINRADIGCVGARKSDSHGNEYELLVISWDVVTRISARLRVAGRYVARAWLGTTH